MSWQAIPLRAAAVADRTPELVDATLRRIEWWQRVATALGYQLRLPDPTPAGDGTEWTEGRRLRIDRLGDRLRPQSRHRAVVRIGPRGLPVFEVRTGPATGGRLTVTVAETGAGLLVTAEFTNPHRGGGAGERMLGVWQARHRRSVVWALRMLVGMVVLDQHQTSVVVAGAVIRDRTVLAARRSHPPALAGCWEFPGGKVVAGETAESALRRELAEELGIQAEVGPQLGPEISLDVELVLRLYRVTSDGVQPTPREHDEIRWLGADDLGSVSWLDADRKLLPVVRRELDANG